MLVYRCSSSMNVFFVDQNLRTQPFESTAGRVAQKPDQIIWLHGPGLDAIKCHSNYNYLGHYGVSASDFEIGQNEFEALKNALEESRVLMAEHKKICERGARVRDGAGARMARGREYLLSKD